MAAIVSAHAAVTFRARFIPECLGRDVGYVCAANGDAEDCSAPALPGCPTINVPKPRLGGQFYCRQDRNLESFVSSGLRHERPDVTISSDAYTDSPGIKGEPGIATDKEPTDRVSALMLKRLVSLNSGPHFVEAGRCIPHQ